MNDPEVTSYGWHFGISDDRALEITIWMEQNAPILEDLQDLRGNYADARIIHGGRSGAEVYDPSMPPGEIRVEIRMKNTDDPAASALIGQIQLIDGITMDVRQVPKSVSELDAEADRLFAANGDPSKEVVYDFDKGEVNLVDGPDEVHTVVDM